MVCPSGGDGRLARYCCAASRQPGASQNVSASKLVPQFVAERRSHVSRSRTSGEGGGHDALDFVLPQLGKEPIAFGRELQLIDGLMQREFAQGVEEGASLCAADEDLQGARRCGREGAKFQRSRGARKIPLP